MFKSIKRFIKSNDWLFQSLKQALIYLRYLKSLVQKDIYSQLPHYNVGETITIASKDSHCYFGYYDKSPFNSDNTQVLFIKVPRNAKEGQEAEVCLYDMKTQRQSIIGKTRTWNLQQGAMEQWIDETTVSYNRYDDAKGEYQTVRTCLDGKETITTRAAYAYNKDHSKYLSLNFHRLDMFAKGYGYPFPVDNLEADKDGIWEVNVTENKPVLLLSLAEVMAFEPREYMQCQHYINHVAYCPDERCIIFIHRWQVAGGEFVSRLLKFNLVSRQLQSLLDNGHVSHYCWKSPQELMIFATNATHKKGYMVVSIESGSNSLIEGMPKEDGHPTYSLDGEWVVTDTYPNNHREQHLFLYHVADKQLYVVDKLYSPFRYFNEHRCDLHPRWSYDCKYLCVDTTASGLRSLKLYKI